jgi:hypothetical protein
VVQGDEIGAMETEEAVWKTVLPGLDALPALQVSLGGVEHGGVTKALQIENLCQRYPAAEVSDFHQDFRTLPGQAGASKGQAAIQRFWAHRFHEIGHRLHVVPGKDKIRGAGNEENLQPSLCRSFRASSMPFICPMRMSSRRMSARGASSQAKSSASAEE